MAVKNISDRQVCIAVTQYKLNGDKFPYELLSEWTGQSEKVCFRADGESRRKRIFGIWSISKNGMVITKRKRLAGKSLMQIEKR